MQTTYPILYAKSSTGAVLIWWMETNEQGNAYRTFSGQKNGQIVESSYTFPKPKNEGKANGTTEETQTELEILAKYKKKRKEKYKDNIKDVDIKEFISPMLAKKYNDYKDSIDFYDGTWGMSPKLNGARCIATKEGLFTRTGEEYLSIPHIHEDLKPFFELYPNAILDGELYNYELRQQLNELMKLVRKTVKITVEELLESAEKVQYHIYDGYIPDDKDLGESVSYDERHDWLHTELDKTSFYYRPVPCTTITDEEQLMKYFNDLLEEGQEGVMLRKTTAGYENKRSKNLLKLKSESDDECEILDVLEGNGNWANKCKTFTVKWNDKVFDVSLKGSMEQAEYIWNNKQNYIGKIATFTFNDLGGLGIPNFARIDINNCFKS